MKVDLQINSSAPVGAAKPWALEKLPPFSAVAMRLVQILSRNDVNVTEVSRFIAAEPVFTTHVLQLANSPLFNARSQVKSISQAIIMLGLERVKAIVLSRALKDFLAPALKVEAMHLCWQNSLAGALLAEKLAGVCGMDSDLAYTAGLLRDIGRLALLVNYPGPYSNLLVVSQDNGFDLIAAERDLFDIDHCQAGCCLMKEMPLPAELRDVVACHHEQPTAGVFGLIELVRVADLLADALGFCAISLLERQPAFEDAAAELPERARARFTFDPDELRAEIAPRIQVLSGNAKPVIPRFPPRRRYGREQDAFPLD
jgi:HD-like signal output (HDOD) protein